MTNAEETSESPRNSRTDTDELGVATIPPPTEPAGPEMDREARMWAMFAHLAALVVLILPGLGLLVGPLLVWLFQRHRFPFVDEQGKEAVNFQITILLYMIVGALLVPLWGIGIAVIVLAFALSLFFMAFAAVKAHHGVHYHYPFPLIIRFIR
jgi:hypothetical protein